MKDTIKRNILGMVRKPLLLLWPWLPVNVSYFDVTLSLVSSIYSATSNFHPSLLHPSSSSTAWLLPALSESVCAPYMWACPVICGRPWTGSRYGSGEHVRCVSGDMAVKIGTEAALRKGKMSEKEDV